MHVSVALSSRVSHATGQSHKRPLLPSLPSLPHTPTLPPHLSTKPGSSTHIVRRDTCANSHPSFCPFLFFLLRFRLFCSSSFFLFCSCVLVFCPCLCVYCSRDLPLCSPASLLSVYFALTRYSSLSLLAKMCLKRFRDLFGMGSRECSCKVCRQFWNWSATFCGPGNEDKCDVKLCQWPQNQLSTKFQPFPKPIRLTQCEDSGNLMNPLMCVTN